MERKYHMRALGKAIGSTVKFGSSDSNWVTIRISGKQISETRECV